MSRRLISIIVLLWVVTAAPYVWARGRVPPTASTRTTHLMPITRNTGWVRRSRDAAVHPQAMTPGQSAHLHEPPDNVAAGPRAGVFGLSFAGLFRVWRVAALLSSSRPWSGFLRK